MATGNRRIGAFILGILLALVSSPSLAQLHSRSASVMLTATLETVSVSATPGFPASRGDGGSRPDSEPVVITTIWAIPAHRTTLRLIGGLSQQSPMRSDAEEAAARPPIAVTLKQSAEAAQCPLTAGCPETAGCSGGGFTLMRHGAGDTNRAESHTDSINLVFGHRNKCQDGFGPGTATFSVQVEAL
jgi:hypothetical protein